MPKDMQNEAFMVDLQKLKSDLERIHNKKRASSESSSALGQLRKQVIEGLGCHKDAMTMIERIDSMSDELRADFLRSFEVMFGAMLPHWKEQLQDMVDKANAQKSDMEGAMG